MDTLPKTASEVFLSARIDKWVELRAILEACRNDPRNRTRGRSADRVARHVSPDQLRRLPSLYRSVSSDLAEARMRRLAPDVLTNLNDLVVCAHSEIYGFRRPPVRDARRFFAESIPAALRHSWHLVLWSALLLLVPLVVSAVVVAREPSLATALLDEGILEQVHSMYADIVTGGGTAGTVAAGTSFYIQHNVSIAFLCFATGVLAGVGTIYMLIYNGLFLGILTGYIIGLGLGPNFLRFVLAHSTFEMSGIIIAGAAGLRLGALVVRAGPLTRPATLAASAADVLTLLAPAVVLITCAALIEALVSPSSLGMTTRIVVAALSAVAVVALGAAAVRARTFAGGRSP